MGLRKSCLINDVRKNVKGQLASHMAVRKKYMYKYNASMPLDGPPDLGLPVSCLGCSNFVKCARVSRKSGFVTNLAVLISST